MKICCVFSGPEKGKNFPVHPLNYRDLTLIISLFSYYFLYHIYNMCVCVCVYNDFFKIFRFVLNKNEPSCSHIVLRYVNKNIL